MEKGIFRIAVSTPDGAVVVEGDCDWEKISQISIGANDSAALVSSDDTVLSLSGTGKDLFVAGLWKGVPIDPFIAQPGALKEVLKFLTD